MEVPVAIGIAVAGLLGLSACGKGGPPQQAGGPTVGYVEIKSTDIPLMRELPARVTAFEASEVRPQVSGIILRRLFTEGSLVHQGQTLYEIDPSLYRAAVNQAQANLVSAQANAEATRARADRYRPLAKIEAVSQQDYTDAAAQAHQASAAVEQNRAQLDTARINLRYTRVPAPITGRIGRSLFTVGTLVSASQTDPLTTIQRLDPIFVDIQQSSADLLALRQALANGGLAKGSTQVRVKLEDGSVYDKIGTIEFSEVLVNQDTGTVTVRARFANPQGLLYPGMFVRAMFAQAVDTHAFLVPVPALTRDPNGNSQIWIIGPDNHAIQKPVTAERMYNSQWVVTSGLKSGDRVIVQGTANLRPNVPVKPVPANTAEHVAPPSRNGNQAGGAPKAG